MIEALQFAFMRRAFLAGILVSIACGMIGTYVVTKRIVFISGGIAHAAYGGVGLGYYVQINLLPQLTGAALVTGHKVTYPVIGALLFSLGAAIVMGVVQRRTRQRADTIIGVLWALGMATGIILIDLTQGYKADLLSYLFGSILAVEPGELWLIFALDLVIAVVVILFFKELLAISFDETFATVVNVPVDALYIALLCLIALDVVMVMRVVGLILVIALLTIPAAIAEQFVRHLGHTMVLASALGIVFTSVGLWLSYRFNLTSGATIILVAGVGYLLALAIREISKQRQSALR